MHHTKERGIYPYLPSGNIIVSDMQTGLYIDCSNPSSRNYTYPKKSTISKSSNEFFNIKKFNANYITLNNSKGQEIKNRFCTMKFLLFIEEIYKKDYIYNLNDGKKLLKSGKIIFEAMNEHKKYKAVIGLEVHAQLITKTKSYSSDSNIYGAKPNTKISPVSLGHPGTLPMVNSKVIELAVKLGLSLGCELEKNEYARKNYFYADLPKGYQITQDKTPICNGGQINIKDKEGSVKKIRLTRIHMEEDAGKSIHDIDPFNTLIDLNGQVFH